MPPSNSKKNKLKVYYDKECQFCKLSIFLIRILFLLPKKTFIPAQENKNIHKEMIKQNSWVIIKNQKKYYYFNAFIPISEASPIFWFLSPIFSFFPINQLGNWVYKIIARNR